MPSETPARPNQNTYWVVPHKFLAGEYPGNVDPVKARMKINEFLEVGVRHFVDLTEPGELVPYDSILLEQSLHAKITATYERFPMRDMTVPRAAADLAEILLTIDRRIREGGAVFVHCWGGIGRTGLVVGCWLQEHGRTPDDALAKLSQKWRTVEKSSQKPESPETTEQVGWVRTWPQRRREVQKLLLRDRYRGALLGLGIGDALGTTLEFKATGTFKPITDMIGGGPFGLQLESLKGKMRCRQVKFYSGVYALATRWFCLSRILARPLNPAAPRLALSNSRIPLVGLRRGLARERVSAI